MYLPLTKSNPGGHSINQVKLYVLMKTEKKSKIDSCDIRFRRCIEKEKCACDIQMVVR